MVRESWQGRTGAWRVALERLRIPAAARELTVDRVAAWSQANEQALAPTTALIVLIALNQICRFAVRRGWLAANPVSKLEPGEKPLWTPIEISILEGDELGRVLAAADPGWQPLFELLAYTGLRIGEALGLCWGRHRPPTRADPRAPPALTSSSARPAEKHPPPDARSCSPPRSPNSSASTGSPHTTSVRPTSCSSPRTDEASTTETLARPSEPRSKPQASPHPNGYRSTPSDTPLPRSSSAKASTSSTSPANSGTLTPPSPSAPTLTSTHAPTTQPPRARLRGDGKHHAALTNARPG